MDQQTNTKHSNLKKRAMFAIGKSVILSRERFKALDSKKKRIVETNGRNESRRVKTDNSASNVDDEFYERRGRIDGKKLRSDNVSEGDDSRGRGLRSNYSRRKVGEGHGNQTKGFVGRDFDGRKKKRDYGSDVGSKIGKWESKDARGGRRKNSGSDENRNGFIRRSGDAKFENSRQLRRPTEEHKHSDVKYENDRRLRRPAEEHKNGDAKFENSRQLRRPAEEHKKGDAKYENGRQLRRPAEEHKNGDAKYENGRQLRRPAEEHKFGKRKSKVERNVSDDSVASFDRPRRKRRLIRIEYPNDTANKRFDDSPPMIDDTPEQKKGPDTEENAEMSRNAQFRAIQPTPSIVSFVNENLLGRRREIEFKRAGYNIELSSPLDNIPFSTSSERERIEESVFRNKLSFFAAAKVSSSFPNPDLPEIAFAGRSNVGKSSLLNSLTRQWGVVRTSDKPGLTQTINFFNLGSKLCLVDLPGYGFAYAKDEVKESWEELVKEYVSTREDLKRVCLLIDTKWGMKPRDHELVDLMERSKTKYQIVLTKTDLAFPIDVARRAMQIEECLKAKKSAVQPLMMVSSKTGAGIRSLRTVLSNISRFARL